VRTSKSAEVNPQTETIPAAFRRGCDCPRMRARGRCSLCGESPHSATVCDNVVLSPNSAIHRSVNVPGPDVELGAPERRWRPEAETVTLQRSAAADDAHTSSPGAVVLFADGIPLLVYSETTCVAPQKWDPICTVNGPGPYVEVGTGTRTNEGGVGTTV